VSEYFRPVEVDHSIVRIEKELEVRQREACRWARWSPLAFGIFVLLFIISASNLHKMLSGYTDMDSLFRLITWFFLSPTVLLSAVAWTAWRFLFLQQRAWENESERIRRLLVERIKVSICDHEGKCSCQEDYLKYIKNKFDISA